MHKGLYKFIRLILLPLLASIVVWLLAAAAVAIFWPYRYLVDKYLRSKYGRQYGGLVDNADVLYFMKNPSMTSINTSIMIGKSPIKRDLLSDARKSLEEKVFNGTDDYLKFNSTVQSCSGYFFIKKGDLTVDEILVSIEKPKDEPFDMSYIEKYVGDMNGGHFVQKGNAFALWDLHISIEPLDGPDDGFHRYPVIGRFHHGIGDGTSLVAGMIRVLGDESCQNYSEELFKRVLAKKPIAVKKAGLVYMAEAYLKTLTQLTKFWLDTVFLAPGRYAIINHFVRADKNALHGPEPTGKKLAAFAVEKTSECVPIIKQMRKRMSDTKFTNVIGTAIAASFVNFFKRNNQPVPEYVTGLITMLLEFPHIDKTKPISFKNKTAGCFFRTPLSYGSKSLPESFKDVSEAMNSGIRYGEAVMCRLIIGNLSGIIPINRFRYLFGMAKSTFLLTNVPGGSRMTLLRGCDCENVIPLAPNLNQIGVSLALLTYDDRFQIGVLVDQALIKTQQEVKTLAEDILVAIKDLDAQTRKVHGD